MSEWRADTGLGGVCFSFFINQKADGLKQVQQFRGMYLGQLPDT
jgi:hypothetical protein